MQQKRVFKKNENTAELLQTQKKIGRFAQAYVRSQLFLLSYSPNVPVFSWNMLAVYSDSFGNLGLIFFFKVSLVSKKNNKRPKNMGVSKNRETPQKMDGENNGKPH